jgi:hypothetical protein
VKPERSQRRDDEDRPRRNETPPKERRQESEREDRRDRGKVCRLLYLVSVQAYFILSMVSIPHNTRKHSYVSRDDPVKIQSYTTG